MNMTQRFFSRVSALAAFALALTAFGPQAQALTTRMDTPIGEIRLAFDTVVSVGISLRTKSRDYAYVSTQNGGSNIVREALEAKRANPDPDFDNGITITSEIPVFGGSVEVGLGPIVIPGVISFKDGALKNFAASANGDDGRLNFDKGDITALTLKVLSDIQADLSTKYGEFTAFMRIQAYADPVLRDGSFYERIGPDDAAKRELGRDIKILDGYLSWDWDLPTGISAVGDLPFNLRVGKLTTNNWGEATFSLSGISAGIVIDVPSARRAGSEIKEIIQPEYMVYGSIGLPFDISLDAYYQFHHTIWNLDVGGSPTATSDLGNPGNEIGSFLWLSSSATSGTFRDNCSRSPFRQVATALNLVDQVVNGVPVVVNGVPVQVAVDPLPPLHAKCGEGSIRDYRTQFDRVPGAAEQLRLDNGDLNAGTRVQFTEADDQGQWGVRLSYYIDTFYLIPPMSMMGMGDFMGGMMEDGFSLPGIEFNFSYQNVHSRVPYVRYGNGGRPVVTKTIIGASSTTGGIALQALGCTGGGAGGDAYAGVIQAAGGDAGTGYLFSGQFRDITLRATQNTVNTDPATGNRAAEINAIRAGLQNPDSLRLALDPQHFRQFAGENSSADGNVGMADFMRYAEAADAILVRVFGGADAMSRADADPMNDTNLAGMHTADTITASVRRNGVNRYDVARIICAQAVTQTDASFAAFGGPAFEGTPAAALAGFAALPVVGSEFLSVQYIPSVELYYPENISVIGGSFNTTIPWMEWGIQGEISYRPNMPLQVDVTSQIVATSVAQGVGMANVGDAARFALGPLVTLTPGLSLEPEDAARSFAELQGVIDSGGIERQIVGTGAIITDLNTRIAGVDETIAGVDMQIADVDMQIADVDMQIADLNAQIEAAGGEANAAAAPLVAGRALAVAGRAEAVAGLAQLSAGRAEAVAGLAQLSAGRTEAVDGLALLQDALAGAPTLRDTFATPFVPAIYERYVAGEFHGRLSEFEADMLNYTIGTTALYNNSNPVVNFLRADQAIFLLEFNAIQFIDTLPGGWDPNGQHSGANGGVALADKNFTLHCIARAGSELPLGGVVGLDSLDNRECTPDDTSMGYTVFGFLDYNNVFGTAWRLRPSMALRHGVKGNTPSPVPGWREDTLSVTWGLEANFQNSWRASMSYVAFFDVGSNDYNGNSGNDSWSFNISYAF